MSLPNCTACTAATVETLRALHDKLDPQYNAVILRGYDARALAGLLEVLAENGYENARIANDECQQKWWSLARYIAEQLEAAVDTIVEAGEATEEITGCLSAHSDKGGDQ